MKNTAEKMSKNTKIAVGAIIIVIIVALIARGASKKKSESMEQSTPQPVMQQPTTMTPPTPKPVVVTKPPVVTPPADTRTYAELLAMYAQKTVQFGASCQVRPNNQSFKEGTSVLLDNRNNMPLSIKLGSTSYSLGAYGYKVITLSTVGKFMVSCNDTPNVATITVQK